MNESFHSLLSLIIPEGVSDYFKLISYTKEAGIIHIYMEEINSIPIEYPSIKRIFKEIILQDFPMRGNEVFLHIKRRR